MCLSGAPGEPYVLEWDSRGTPCAWVTLPGNPMCLSDNPGEPYVLEWHSRGTYVLEWYSRGTLCAGDSLTWKYKSFQIPISCFLIDLKFISKLLQMFFMEHLSFPEPHLHKTYFKKYIFKLFSKNNVRTIQTYFSKSKWWICLSKKHRTFSKFQILRYETFFKDDPIIVLVFFEPFW